MTVSEGNMPVAQIQRLYEAGARYHESSMPSKAPWYCDECREHVFARSKARRAKDKAATAAYDAKLDALADAGGCGCWWATAAGKGYATTDGRSPEQLLAGLRAGRMIGLRPASLGLLVVDVDWPAELRSDEHVADCARARDLVIDAVKPDAWYASVSKWGAHLLVRLERVEALTVRNSKWSMDGDGGPAGEIRCATGFVVTPAWAFPRLVTAYEARPRTLADLPDFLKLGGGASKPTAKRKSASKLPDASAEDLADALRHVAGVDDYDEWIAVGAALHGWHATAGLALWKDWSRTGAKHADGDCELKWATFGSSPVKAGAGSIFRRAKERGWRNRARRQAPPPVSAPSPRQGAADADNVVYSPTCHPEALKAELVVTGGRTLANLQAIVAHLGYEFRSNTRSGRMEVRDAVRHGSKGPLEHWHQLSDELSAGIRDDIANNVLEEVLLKKEQEPQRKPMQWSRSTFRDKLLAWARDAGVDPFCEWLLSLPDWDGTARLDSLLHDMFDADADPLSAWAGRAIFMAPVQRGLMLKDKPNTGPGCKIDEMPVLFSAVQGYGKSALLREVFPPEGQTSLFTDAFAFDSDIKTQAEAQRGRVLVESSELAGLSHADHAKMKPAISRTHITGVRMAFREYVTDEPRRDFIVGTTDRAECLPSDEAGNRRFVVVELKRGCNVEAFMAKHRLQLWAEALHRYRHGERAPLPRSLHSARDERNEGHRTTDMSFEGRVAALKDDSLAYAHAEDAEDFSLRWLGEATKADGRWHVDADGKKTWLPNPTLRRQAQHRLAAALKALGWTRGKNKKTFVDPDNTPAWTNPWTAPPSWKPAD